MTVCAVGRGGQRLWAGAVCALAGVEVQTQIWPAGVEAASCVWGPLSLQWQTPLRVKWTHRVGVTSSPITPAIDLIFIVTPRWGRRV